MFLNDSLCITFTWFINQCLLLDLFFCFFLKFFYLWTRFFSKFKSRNRARGRNVNNPMYKYLSPIVVYTVFIACFYMVLIHWRWPFWDFSHINLLLLPQKLPNLNGRIPNLTALFVSLNYKQPSNDVYIIFETHRFYVKYWEHCVNCSK